jgi:hypothetical protein
MSTNAESAELVLKLYDLRREKKMRKAREWFFSYNPTSVEDYMQTMMKPKVGAYLRMVTSYWDMAAAMVNQGCIDADVFDATNSEHYIVFAKIEPLLADLRKAFDRPTAFSNLESVINDRPNGAERLRKTQEFLAGVAARQQAAETDDDDDGDERSAAA